MFLWPDPKAGRVFHVPMESPCAFLVVINGLVEEPERHVTHSSSPAEREGRG